MSAPAASGAEVLRGPWQPRMPVACPHDPEAAERAVQRRRESARAHRERVAGSAAVSSYEALLFAVLVARTESAVAATNGVLELLATLDDEQLRTLIRQRLAGHRIR